MRKFIQTVAFAPMFLLSQQVQAISIAQQPLFIGGVIAPNIMLLFDDSGSMQWESLPSDGHTFFVYPRAEGVYDGDEEYTNYVPEFSDDNWYSRRIRSPQGNQLYYNPAITYTPWVDANGASLGDATPSCAWHNPMNQDDTTEDYCRDLTSENTATAYWDSFDGDIADFPPGDPESETEEDFWPAVYHRYDGGGEYDKDNYTTIEIRDPDATYTGGANRTDCASAPTCTYAEEIRNFANWYTYYRSRALLARNGIGKAFAAQSSGMRVGFGAINQGSATVDGFSSPRALIDGVREFSGTDRSNFFTSLYTHPINKAITPLRSALDSIGQYYQWGDDRGPWGKLPGTADTTAHYECRQSFTVLMTDGYWNGPHVVTALNADNETGPAITGPNGASYQYTPAAPYQGVTALTLADVAMYYWNRDLRPNLTNAVPTNAHDEAFWQHMVTYTVGLGVTGTLDPDTDLPGLIDGDIDWPDFNVQAALTDPPPETIDDLWHAAVNSRGDFFSAADPGVFADRLEATLASIGNRVSSAAAIATNSTRLNSSTFVYQARFDSTDWHGQFLAYQVDATNGDVAQTATWDAASLIPTAASRTILTHDSTLNSNAGGGALFLWDSLNDAQRTHLDPDYDATDATSGVLGQKRLAWLRGDASNEQRNGGALRNRINGVLGDIVNSDPWRVAQDDYGYHKLSGTEGSSYIDFRNGDDGGNYPTRSKVIYVGSNDGMLHAFDAGTWNSTTQAFDPGTGAEKFAYVPEAVFANLHELTEPSYAHRYFVDGPSRASDAYLLVDADAGTRAWKTILVGTLGGGGKAVFALDVTDPDSMDASKVLWELTDDTDLGYTIGQATVARMANGNWAAIFGNGYDSASGKAILFIRDLDDGTVYKLDTGSGDATTKNGLSTPTVVDINNDGIADYIYAGDLFGKLWKFDVTGSNTNQWDVAFKQGNTPLPLFSATDGSGNAQPITAKVDVAKHPSNGRMVFFGTGKYVETSDVTSTGVQTLYGIWDGLVDSNNQNQDGETVSGRSELVEQKILIEETLQDDAESDQPFNIRITSSNTVNYDVDDPETTDDDPAERKGWFMDLVTPTVWSTDGDGNITVSTTVAKGERVVSSPILHDGRVLFTTMIPDANPCNFGGTSWTMDLTAIDGSQPSVSPFDFNNDGSFDAEDYHYVDHDDDDDPTDVVGLMVSGKQSTVGITKTPAVIRVGDREYRYAGGSEGGIEKTAGARSTKTGRQSWWQIR